MNSAYGKKLKLDFFKSVGPTSAVTLLSMAIMYISQALLARILGVDQYGKYFYVLSWLSIAVIFCKLGLDTTIQRYLPEYKIKKLWSLCKGLLRKCGALSFFSGIAFSVIGILILFYVSPVTDRMLAYTFYSGTIALPIWSLCKVTQGALLAFKKPIFSIFPDGIVVPTLLVLSLWLISTYSEINVSSLTAMSTHAILLLLSLIISLSLLQKFCITHEIKNASEQHRLKEWMIYAFPMLLISGTQLVMNYADVIIIGILIGTRDAGIYGAASKIAGIVTIGLLFANSVLAPYISELFHNNKVHYLQYLVTYSTRIASIIAVLILLSFYFYGDIILKLFGEEFTVGHNAMVILSIGAILNVMSGSVGLLMSMTGHQKQAVSFFITGCIINIVLNLLFIPRYGIEGAAIATAISIAFWNISLAIYIKYKISINSTIFNTLKYVNKNP